MAALDSVPEVVIDPDGVFKYILVRVSSEPERYRDIVRGTKSAEYHSKRLRCNAETCERRASLSLQNSSYSATYRPVCDRMQLIHVPTVIPAPWGTPPNKGHSGSSHNPHTSRSGLLIQRRKFINADSFYLKGDLRHLKVYSDHIFEKLDPEMQALGLKCKCLGGGKIEHNSKDKKIRVFGESTGYGKADHSVTSEKLRNKYSDYEVVWSDEKK